jgi:hypothetical protein
MRRSLYIDLRTDVTSLKLELPEVLYVIKQFIARMLPIWTTVKSITSKAVSRNSSEAEKQAPSV